MPAVRGAEDDVEEEGGEDDLGDEDRDEAVAAGGVLGVAVGCETGAGVEAVLAGGDGVEHATGEQAGDDLGPDVGGTSFQANRMATAAPIVTAGLKWPPETWPTAYAIVRTVRPKASETPTKPMPRPVSAPSAMCCAAKIALPQPPRTSQKVPRASAPRRWASLGSV